MGGGGYDSEYENDSDGGGGQTSPSYNKLPEFGSGHAEHLSQPEDWTKLALIIVGLFILFVIILVLFG